MASKYLSLLFGIATLWLSGCTYSYGYGWAYTDVHLPRSTDFRNTPVGTKTFHVNQYRIKEPVTGYDLTTEWDTSDIKTAAQKAGIKQIYYSETHIQSYLGEMFKKTQIIFYGD